MPKGVRGGNKATPKGTPKRGPKGRRGLPGSDEDSVCDTASVFSMNSDRASCFDEGDNGNNMDDFEDGSSGSTATIATFGESLEDKVAEAIDRLTEKSANVRLTSLQSLINVLQQGYNPGLLLSRRETLRDNLERILKRGAANEQALAATVYSLFAILIGGFDADMAAEDFVIMKPVLKNLTLDHTASINARAKACEALCLGSLLVETSLQDVATLITFLEPLFRLKPKMKEVEKSDAFGIGASPAKSLKAPKAVSNALACSAVAGWTLLLTVMSTEFLTSRVNRWVKILHNMLDDNDLELRLHVGEALAVLFELCDLSEEESEGEDASEAEYAIENGNSKIDMEALIAKLRSLSVESNKFRAKKDKRVQHHNFRDFLKAVEEGDGPTLRVKFENETLEIVEWSKKRQYDAVSDVLGNGLNKHFGENPLLRQVFEMGAPKLVVDNPNFDAKQAKSERQYMNALNFKARCVNRGKNRDNRMAALEDY